VNKAIDLTELSYQKLGENLNNKNEEIEEDLLNIDLKDIDEVISYIVGVPSEHNSQDLSELAEGDNRKERVKSQDVRSTTSSKLVIKRLKEELRKEKCIRQQQQQELESLKSNVKS
jgi:hypothetical protein